MAGQTLIVGYGNTLRSDDGVGPALAAIVSSWHVPRLRVLATQGLVPELAEMLAECERVLFADASAADAVPRLVPLAVQAAPAASLHFSDPGGLLALTLALHGRCPEAWLLLLPADDFAFGEELSAVAQQGLEAGAGLVRSWLNLD